MLMRSITSGTYIVVGVDLEHYYIYCRAETLLYSVQHVGVGEWVVIVHIVINVRYVIMYMIFTS